MKYTYKTFLKDLKNFGTALLYVVVGSAIVLVGGSCLDRLAHGSVVPSPFHPKNWGLLNDLSKSHISAPQAWKIEMGKSTVVVAVLDTGVDFGNYDLAPARAPAGWNFVTNKADPVDEHGHGTHVAGIVHVVAPGVQIMSLKYYSDANTGKMNLLNTVNALNYAVDHGAKIINYSGGGPEYSEDEFLALKRAEAAGILVVAAAGNEHQDVDLVGNYYYPAAYRLSNIIVVAATDIRNNLLATSNWGKTRVDVTAPGENIRSDLPGNRAGYMSGTSQATAFVSGIAALVLSHFPKLTPAQIRRRIMETVDTFPQLSERVVSGGRVNAYRALQP